MNIDAEIQADIRDNISTSQSSFITTFLGITGCVCVCVWSVVFLFSS